VERVSVYVDGFNLYFGIIDRGWRRYLWLDIGALAQRLLAKEQILIQVKYFTARVRGDPAKVHRQSTYLQALSNRGNIHILYGRYQEKSKKCFNCNSTWKEYEEKMSDVRIASELLRDAFLDNFDTTLIVSADADLQPPIEIIKTEFPQKKVVIAFPPRRDSYHLRKIADAHFRIGRGRLSKCQLPPRITKPDGHTLKKPTDWA
jgi:uncharacterized LabA/DUF88 family protein